MASDIGLSFDKDGKLSLDADTPKQALSDNYDGVMSLVSAAATGASDNDYVQFAAAAPTTVAGSYEVEVNYNDSGAITTARIRNPGDTAWRYLDISGSTLTGQLGTPEAGLSLTVTSDGTSGAHTQSATVRVRQGFGTAIYNNTQAILDKTTGAIACDNQRLDTDITNLNKQIQTWQDRLDKEQATLKATFARLEATLAKMDVQRAAVEAMSLSNQNTSGTTGTSSSSSSNTSGS